MSTQRTHWIISATLVGVAGAALLTLVPRNPQDIAPPAATPASAAASVRVTADTVQPVSQLSFAESGAARSGTERERQEVLSEGAVYSDEGLLLALSRPYPAAPVDRAVMEQRRSLLFAASGPADTASDGFSDHVVQVSAGTDIESLEQQLSTVDGQLLRFLPNQRVATVRLPEHRIAELAALTGVVAAAKDEPLVFMSVPAKETIGLDGTGAATLQTVNTGIGVAVIDTGVEEQPDLVVAKHINLSTPETRLMNTGRVDDRIESLYLFDEHSSVVYDRKGVSREHLVISETPEGVVVAPDAVNWSRLPAIDYSRSMVQFTFNNAGNTSVNLHIVTSPDGQSTQQYTRVSAGQSTTVWSFPNENWLVTPWNSSEKLAVLVNPAEQGAVTYGTAAAVEWKDQGLRVTSGVVGSIPDARVPAACSMSNATTIEMWLTPADNVTNQDIVVAKAGYKQQFAIRQMADRMQGRIGIINGGVFSYSRSGTVIAGKRTHVVVRRDAAGALHLYLDGWRHWSTGINGSTPLGWTEEQTIELLPWNGSVDMLAIHCDALSAGEILQNYYAGPNAYQSVHDAYGHGTHVAGTIAGTGARSGGEYAGVAPGAPIYDLRILNEHGKGSVSQALAAIDWLLANAHQEGIRVVNMSVGKSVQSSVADDLLVQGVEKLVDSGLVVVASAGNYGNLGNFRITSPGNAPSVITVGALDTNDSSCVSDDVIAAFSSRGPTLYDHYLKPDLVAPGTRVIAPTATLGSMKTLYPQRLEACSNGTCAEDYFRLSGTSMAAAMTSGAAVLMLSKDASLNPATVKARLMRSARKIDGDPVATGAGVLDVVAALAETGAVDTAPTPRLFRNEAMGKVAIEDTGSLWGNPAFSAANLWSNGFLWTNEGMSANGFLWTDEGMNANGFLWTDAHMWANGFLWTDTGLWSNGFLWTDLSVIANGFLWTFGDHLTAHANDFDGSASGTGKMCSVADGREQIDNGGFEQGGTGWWGIAEGQVKLDSNAYAGDTAMRLLDTGCTWRRIDVDFVAGQTVTLSGYHETDKDGITWLYTRYLDSAWNKLGNLAPTEWVPMYDTNGQYERFSFSNTVPQGTAMVELMLCSVRDNFIDELSLR